MDAWIFARSAPNDLGRGRNRERVRGLAIAFVVVALVPVRVRADELELALDGVCRGDLSGEIAAAVGRPLDAGPTRVRARIAMRSEGPRVRVVVGLDHGGARSERRFTASSCAAATHAAALVVALALDRREPVAAPEPVAIEAAPPAPALELSFETQLFETREEESAPAPNVEPVRVSFVASALIDDGSLPGLEGGARIGGGVSIAPFLVELDATYLSASRAPSPQPGASVDLVLAFGTLRAGARAPLLSWLSLGGAIELDVGAMSGSGAGVRLDAPASALLPWVALRGALLLEVAISSVLSIRAAGSIGTPLVAPTFAIDGAGTAFSPAIVLGQGSLGLVVRLS